MAACAFLIEPHGTSPQAKSFTLPCEATELILLALYSRFNIDIAFDVGDQITSQGSPSWAFFCAFHASCPCDTVPIIKDAYGAAAKKYCSLPLTPSCRPLLAPRFLVVVPGFPSVQRSPHIIYECMDPAAQRVQAPLHITLQR